MKTLEQVKTGLRCESCTGCSYYNQGTHECIGGVDEDALNYIQQLENHIGELTEKVAQFEAAQPKWISSDDRLPDCLKDVITLNQIATLDGIQS